MTTRTPKHDTSATKTSATPATQVQSPPRATVPTPPEDYDPNSAASYASAQPRKAELANIGSAVTELGKFADYAQVFGKTAPPVAHLVETLQAASDWSTLLVATILWSGYVRAGSATAWKDARGLIEGLKIPFQLAVKADPTVSTTLPAVTRLLGVARASAAKGVSTRKANAKDKAEGKPPTHGKVGKRLQRAAAKASSVAASTEAPTPTPAAPPAAPVTPAAPATVVTNGSAQS